jgi:hypothetical protein
MPVLNADWSEWLLLIYVTLGRLLQLSCGLNERLAG